MKKEMEPRPKYVGGHFPDKRQTWLLKAALLDKPRASACFEEWLQSCNLAYLRPGSATFLSDFMDTLDTGSQRMLPLVIHNLGDEAHPYFKFLSGTRKNYWVKTKQILFNVQKVRQVLTENGIPSILIKGADLATRYYPNDTLRPMADGDVLIPFSAREKALKLAVKGLFGNTISGYDYFMKDYRHGIYLRFDGQEGNVDLHWNVFKEYASEPGASDYIWDNLVEAKTGIGMDKRMQDTHAFFVCLVHGRNFGMVPPFRWVADVMLIYRNAEHIDWDELLSLCRKFHFKPFVKRAFAFLVNEFDMKVPSGFIGELEKMQPSPLEEKYYAIIAESFQTDGLFLRLRSNFRHRSSLYHLFLRESHFSSVSYFAGWFIALVKTKLFSR